MPGSLGTGAAGNAEELSAGVAAGAAAAGAGEDAVLEEFALALNGPLATELESPGATGLDMAAGSSICETSIETAG
jgi:hypothetical protein